MFVVLAVELASESSSGILFEALRSTKGEKNIQHSNEGSSVQHPLLVVSKDKTGNITPQHHNIRPVTTPADSNRIVYEQGRWSHSPKAATQST
jgi:hypothetical protein